MIRFLNEDLHIVYVNPDHVVRLASGYIQGEGGPATEIHLVGGFRILTLGHVDSIAVKFGARGTLTHEEIRNSNSPEARAAAARIARGEE